MWQESVLIQLGVEAEKIKGSKETTSFICFPSRKSPYGVLRQLHGGRSGTQLAPAALATCGGSPNADQWPVCQGHQGLE